MAHELPQPGEDALPVRYSWVYLRPSSREESHLPAIPDLGQQSRVAQLLSPCLPGEADPRPVVVSKLRKHLFVPRSARGLSAAVKRWHPVAGVSGARCRGRG
jgi:hypothetical protein